MKLLIDSDVVSALSSPEFPEYQRIQQFFNQYHTAKIHLSILTVFEVEFNIASFKSDKHRQQQRDNLNVFKNAFGMLICALTAPRDTANSNTHSERAQAPVKARLNVTIST